MVSKWFEQAFRRSVVDMHIDDWDPRFLSEYSVDRYVEMLKLGKAQSAVIYAHSHVGHCYYPTKVGHMHEGLKGRDVFKELIEKSRKNGIKAVAYYSLIFNNWAYKQNPDWRMIGRDGKEAAEKSRYGVVCPNSPYRDFIVKEIREICSNYDFDGIRFDMTFWPMACYCHHCRTRFANEVGGEIPQVVDWRNPRWVAFQRRREAWLVEFASLATQVVRELKPGISVEHQSSTYPLGWQFGVTTPLRDQNDFLQGDFYGGALQQSFVCKLLNNLTPMRPAGYETSLTRHIGGSGGNTYKTEDLLKMQVYGAMANSAAFIYIDAINPVGTLNRTIYEVMGRVFSETEVYEPHLGGDTCADVAIFLSTESKFIMADETKEDAAVTTNANGDKFPHTENALNAAQAMIESHVPYTVITNKNINDLNRYQVVVLPNVMAMDKQEIESIRHYVANGGSLFASKYTSLYLKDGTTTKDFQLGDLFGVSWAQERTAEDLTYIQPTAAGRKHFPLHCNDSPLSIVGSQLLVKAREGAEVLGTLMLPYTNPSDPSRFASIHCNPPGRSSDNPTLVYHKYGKGQVVYAASELEFQEANRGVFSSLIKSLLKQSPVIETNAPACVEITVFWQQDKKRYTVSVLNFQKDMPNLPVENIQVRLNIPGKKARQVTLLPKGEKWAAQIQDGAVEFTINRLQDFAMFAVDCG